MQEAKMLWKAAYPAPPESRRDNVENTHEMASLPVRAWWTMDSTALRDLEQAGRFGTNTLIIESDTQGVWSEVVDGLALYEFSARHRRDGARRARVETLRHHYTAITKAARQRGLNSYVMCSELSLPDSFEPLALSYDNPEMWRLVYERLREVFRALPCLDGFMLYLAEARYDVTDLPGSEPSMTARYERVIDTVWQACRAEGRKLLVTTFIHRPERLKAVAEALRRLAPHPDLAVVQYCCPNDWGLYALANPSIGQVGPHPEILGFDYAAENWGQGAHPFVQVHFMARRLRESLRRGARIAGLAGYVAWYGRRALGSLNEANIDGAAVLAADPQRSAGDILHAWCVDRFGEKAARVAARCLARTHDVVFHAQHVFGYWLDTSEKSGLPSFRELQEYLIDDAWGEALYRWDGRHRRTWEKIQAPDRAFLAAVLAEKDHAIDLCRRSLGEVRVARGALESGDFECLEQAFAFQEHWARLWRALVHAFFLYRIGLVQRDMPGVVEDLRAALASLSRTADELEAGFGRDVFPPGPDRARDFISSLHPLTLR